MVIRRMGNSEPELRVACSDALPRLLNSSIGKADNVQCWNTNNPSSN